MTEEKFQKAAIIKQKIASLKVQQNEVLKFKAFTVNHKNHVLVVNSTGEERGIQVSCPDGILTSKDTTKIAEIMEVRINKKLKKLRKAFKKL